MANNKDNKEKNEIAANCDESQMDVTKCDNNEVVGNIESLIKIIRGQQVMLDRDLAHFMALKQSVLMSK